MMFHDELTLVSFGDAVVDAWGNQVREEIHSTVFCSVANVSRSEFYQASTAGLHPAFTVYIHPFEYAGQKLADLNGIRYSITRTYIIEIDGIAYLETQLVDRIGNG